MTVTSYNPTLSDTGEGLGLDLGGIQQMAGQSRDEDDVTVRLYAGRVLRGELQGARVMLKAYPQAVGRVGAKADEMASNELRAHGALQPPSAAAESEYLCKLLGGFVVGSGAGRGEQWLVFRNDGVATAANYASVAAEAGAKQQAVGDGQFWDRWNPGRSLKGRKLFVVSILRQTLLGLQDLHARNRLHQSLGPGSVVLSTIQERDVAMLRCRLRDLAFSVDVSDAAMLGGPTIAEIFEGVRMRDQDKSRDFSEGLWRRAERGGANSAALKRSFGIADDIYSAGLLLAYMVFVSFSEPGSVDGTLLQRLIEVTFRLDFNALREYADADSRWAPAVEFLSGAGGAGWELLAAMMNPDWRLRPTAASCLQHPFLNGAAVV